MVNRLAATFTDKAYLRATAAISAFALLSACASRLILQPVAYQTLPRPEVPVTLAEESKGEPMTGYARPLPAGMRLQPVGRIPQGLVMRPVGREIMISGEDREEGYVVVQGTSWVGYYLPFEKAYLALRQPVPYY